MNAYDLSPEAKKFLGRWSRDLYYVYVRYETSRWAEPNEKEGPWFVVSVQIRGLPPHEMREEGRSLDQCVLRLGERVPRRSDLRADRDRADNVGFLAPHSRWMKRYKKILGEDTLVGRSLRTEKQSKENALRTKHVGPIHDRVGENKPSDSSEKGYGAEKVKKSKKKKTKKK